VAKRPARGAFEQTPVKPVLQWAHLTSPRADSGVHGFGGVDEIAGARDNRMVSSPSPVRRSKWRLPRWAMSTKRVAVDKRINQQYG
jgi:hypothetical protein